MNDNHIRKYAKAVVDQEKKLQNEDPDYVKGQLVKLDFNFKQHDIKMLADVIEALLGAMFLD